MSSGLRKLFINPLLQLGRSYNATAQKYPMGTGVVTTVVKTSAADLFAQMVSLLLGIFSNLQALRACLLRTQAAVPTALG